MNGTDLPVAPPGFNGRLVEPPESLDRWSGASGPFWHPPAAVALPHSVEDVSLLVAWAHRHGLSLVPRGGGTGMPGGNVGPGVVVDLSSLSRIEPEAPGAHSIRAQAGATGLELLRAARERGFDLPALPSSARWCTLGGMLACNAAGARSFRYGAARSWVSEATWVRADGTVETLDRDAPAADEWHGLRASLAGALPEPLPWPDVRKNSSGYALDHFLERGSPLDLAIGSEGTLGILVEATIRLQRTPDSRAVAILGVPKVAELGALAEAVGSIAGAVACEYFGRRLAELGNLGAEPLLSGVETAAGIVLVEVAGDADEVGTGIDALRDLVGPGELVTATDPAGMEALWEFRHAASPTVGRELAGGRRSTQFIEDCVVPVTALGDFVLRLEEILSRSGTDAVIFGHAGDGNLHVNPLVDLTRSDWRDRVRTILEETVELVADLGGTLAGEHGDGRVRTPFLDRIFHPAVVEGFRMVKSALDPAAVLNPGVIVPLDGVDPLAGLGDAPGFHTGTQGPERHR